ncbi:methionine ABC transporter ATP-binding protein [uncultured Microbacterium sp.]|uniref:methionine ABC transporter ATP-binding protein n=1 Tax=uncultured Microbacterium sp. TaxID=191216 RepID=UPI0025D7DB00|nr:methionine ABC transporter ATP-binding protein [uncultured Microbacterium sp.]
MTAVIELRGVTKSFRTDRRTSTTAVDDVSLTVEEGSIVGIIGYSGAGKSTLVRLLNGLEQPTSGTVKVLGVDVGDATEAKLRDLRRRVGMIFQQFNLFTSRTVAANVAYPLKVAGWKKADRDKRVAELLDFVGIGDKAKQYPRRLSGGQKQRVGIARAIATDPRILLADEATSALDPQTTAEVLDLLREINRRLGITIVVITHQASIVHELCDQVIVMDGGRVVDSGDTYRVFAHPRAELTKRFVAAVTQGVPSGEALSALAAGGGDLVSVEINEFSSEDVSAVFHRHDARHSVVYGGVTDVLGRQLGTLTYRVHADDLDAVVAELRAHTEVAVPAAEVRS